MSDVILRVLQGEDVEEYRFQISQMVFKIQNLIFDFQLIITILFF